MQCEFVVGGWKLLEGIMLWFLKLNQANWFDRSDWVLVTHLMYCKYSQFHLNLSALGWTVSLIKLIKN